jgi:membrane-associated phospholipid phosphatase
MGSDFYQHSQRVRWLMGALAAAAGLLVLTLADKWLWANLRLDHLPINDDGWFQLLRQAGYLPTWVLVALMMFLHDRGKEWPKEGFKNARHRATLLVLSAGMGGLAAEVIKAAVSRYRPGSTGDYYFKWLPPTDVFFPGYGMASSHAGVAFGAAFMLWKLFPRVGPVALVLAVGCSFTRVVMGVHFVTDVYVAGVLSYVVAVVLWTYAGPFARPRIAQERLVAGGEAAGSPT